MDVRVTYDSGADAAYIFLCWPQAAGVVDETVVCDPLPEKVDGSVNLDFDAQGRLVGIEVLGASRVLPQQVLDRAERRR